MSDVSAASFVDDGAEFSKRTRNGSGWDIGSWVGDIQDDRESSTMDCTWGFVDDAPGLLPPSGTPSFVGKPNSHFYQTRQPMNHSKKCHPGVQRAVGGQINNTLASIKSIMRFNVRPAEEQKPVQKPEPQPQPAPQQESKTEVGPSPGAVRVWLPPDPSNCVIHGQGGHAIVLDGPEEPIDSRPPKESEAEDARSNYKAPTVEDAPDPPATAL